MRRIVAVVSVVVCCIAAYLGWRSYIGESPDKRATYMEPALAQYGPNLRPEAGSDSHANEPQREDMASEEVDRRMNTDFEVPRPFSWVFEPVGHPDSAGPVDMLFNFRPTEYCPQCDKVILTVATENGLEYIGRETWTVQVDTTTSYSTVLNIILPPRDTCRISVKMESAGIHSVAVRYFVTTGDSVEFWKGFPEKSFQDVYEVAGDTAKYEVKVDLRDRRRYETIERFADSVGQ